LELLKLCLERDVKKRRRDAGDLVLDLDRLSGGKAGRADVCYAGTKRSMGMDGGRGLGGDCRCRHRALDAASALHRRDAPVVDLTGERVNRV
jgi:hypothetical protein